MPDAPLTKVVRSLRGGQITIPAEFRQRLGIGDETLLRLTLGEGDLRIEPVRVVEAGAGSPWLRELYDYFAPVRDEIEASGVSEAELNADIDAAVAAVRADRRLAPR
ncbi:MAG: AbrB/MazE/SpoVT family DNA-binding domain-containing protein [Chloroflexia bacterium]|nr:AbrB/MazE/SpoVT family DNA-binding domain-containing protein [Chloroflexia bacterium]